jgi:hypothetical protein
MSIPNPNTQPIYPSKPLVWHQRLTTQVNGFDPMANTSVSPPALLGRASESGALLEHVTFFSAYTAPPAGSDGSSGNTPTSDDGPYGLGVANNPKSIIFYSRRPGSNELVPIIDIPLLATPRQQFARWAFFPILPDPQVGLRLTPEEELYVSLSKAVPAPGVWVSVRGGHYSNDGKTYFG